MSKGGGLAGAILGAVVIGVASAAAESPIKSVRKSNKPRPKNVLNIKCKCGAQMTLNRAKYVYSNCNSCNCDLCRKHISSYNWVYHCNDHRNNIHPRGYDLCLNCSQKMHKHQQKTNQIENNNYIQNELISMGFNKNDIQQILPKIDKSDKRKAVHTAVKLLCNKPKNNANIASYPNYIDMNPSAPVMEEEGKTFSETKIEYEQEGVPDIDNMNNNYVAGNNVSANIHTNGYNYSNNCAIINEQKFDDIAQPSAPVLEEESVNNMIVQTENKIDVKCTNTECKEGKVNELIYKKGWMMKSGALNVSFKARFFELEKNKKLKYDRAEPMYDKFGYHFGYHNYLCGTVDFNKCKISKMHKLKNNQFHIVTKERTWKFSCNSEQQRNEWYDAIKLICTASK